MIRFMEMKTKGLFVFAGVAGVFGVVIFCVGFLLIAHGVFHRGDVAYQVWALLAWPLVAVALLPIKAVFYQPVAAGLLMFVGYALLGAVIYRFIA